MQYAAMIKNFLKYDENGKSKGANYIVTGLWSNQCINEAKKMMTDTPPTETANGISSNYKNLAEPETWNIKKDASFIHYCQNETVHGFEYQDNENDFPVHLFEGQIVICDMSSDIGSRKVDWNKYGMVYAGCQKNLGAAGATLVVVREDLIGHQAKDTPFLFDYSLFDKSPNSYFNTPATYPIYITGLNVAHMLKQGGLDHYIALANKRSKMMYDCIDNSGGFYINSTDKRFRSRTNVPFRIRPDAGEEIKTYTRLENLFIEEAAARGLLQLRGHSTNPGIRASMYNALAIEGV